MGGGATSYYIGKCLSAAVTCVRVGAQLKLTITYLSPQYVAPYYNMHTHMYSSNNTCIHVPNIHSSSEITSCHSAFLQTGRSERPTLERMTLLRLRKRQIRGNVGGVVLISAHLLDKLQVALGDLVDLQRTRVARVRAQDDHLGAAG